MALNSWITTDSIVTAIHAAITEMNLHLPKNRQIEEDPQTVLFGAGGRLDSLGLANFIIIMEQQLEQSLGMRIDLTEDDPFSPETGHFRTLGTLARYIGSSFDAKTGQ